MRVLIAGAGIMGLAAAHDLLEDGHQVTVFEAAPTPGGLAGSFDFGGVPAEKFYHFICGADRVYFRWLERLGLSGRLRWRRSSMGVWRDAKLHRFGDPLSLLRFRPLSFGARVRYGLHVLAAKRIKDWKPLEHVPARDWLVEGEGEEAYRVIWEPLLRQKFGEDTNSIAAAWIWSRIARLASSRNAIFQEWLGFLDGGSRVFVDKLVDAVISKGGVLRCGSPVERLLVDGGRVAGFRVGGAEHEADGVVSTVPLPILGRLGADLPPSYLKQAASLRNIGVRCLVVKMKRPVTPFFWINVNDDDLPLCGLIEYTNLNPDGFDGCSLIYSPLYCDPGDPAYRRADTEVLEEALGALARTAPGMKRSDVLDYRVFREPFAQPVCPVGFTERLAPMATPAQNLVAADTTHLLPHDRSISDSLALAERLTETFRTAVVRRA